jgi:hypothetical protein
VTPAPQATWSDSVPLAVYDVVARQREGGAPVSAGGASAASQLSGGKRKTPEVAASASTEGESDEGADEAPVGVLETPPRGNAAARR